MVEEAEEAEVVGVWWWGVTWLGAGWQREGPHPDDGGDGEQPWTLRSYAARSQPGWVRVGPSRATQHANLLCGAVGTSHHGTAPVTFLAGHAETGDWESHLDVGSETSKSGPIALPVAGQSRTVAASAENAQPDAVHAATVPVRTGHYVGDQGSKLPRHLKREYYIYIASTYA